MANNLLIDKTSIQNGIYIGQSLIDLKGDLTFAEDLGVLRVIGSIFVKGTVLVRKGTDLTVIGSIHIGNGNFISDGNVKILPTDEIGLRSGGDILVRGRFEVKGDVYAPGSFISECWRWYGVDVSGDLIADSISVAGNISAGEIFSSGKIYAGTALADVGVIYTKKPPVGEVVLGNVVLQKRSLLSRIVNVLFAKKEPYYILGD